MLVKDLLQQKIFKDSRTLTGTIGLDNPIESVMIIEALDIEKWAVRNQILLTSYVAFQDKNLDEIKEYFEKISSIGISGIIIKIRRFIQEVPSHFIELCNSHEIPLIEIPPTITYESIILSIHEPLLNYESFLLRRYYEASKIFSNLVNPRYSYEDLVRRFTDFTGLSVSLKIPESSFFFQSESFPSLPNYQYVEFEVQNLYAQHHYYLRSYTTPEETEEIEFYYLDIKNITDVRRYSFLIHVETKSIDHSLILAIEKFLEVLSQKLDAEYYRKNEIFLHRNKTISAILFDINKDAYDLKLLLEEISLFDHPYYQVVLITLPNQFEKHQLRPIRKAFDTIGLSNVYYESKNTLVYILNIEKETDRIQKKTLKTLLPRIDKVHYFLSKAGHYLEISQLFSTCLKMKQFNDSFYISDFIDQEDLGIFNFLISIPPENYNNMVPDELLQLFNDKPDLFETLYIFIINHLNYGSTAKELYLHPKTIRYRISKITQLLQLDLGNPIQLANYTIGCILLNLKKKKEKTTESSLEQ